MKIINTLLLVIISLFLINCTNNENKGFSLNRKIKGGFNDYIYFKYNNTIDSSLIKDKKFSFKGEILNPTGAFLYPGNPSSNIPMSVAGFMLENSDISIYLKYSEREIIARNIKPSKLNEILINQIGR